MIDDTQYMIAINRIEELMARDSLDDGDSGLLEVLVEVVIEYEATGWYATCAEYIRGNLDRESLLRVFGKSRVSELLTGRRQPSLGQIKELVKLGLSANVLVFLLIKEDLIITDTEK